MNINLTKPSSPNKKNKHDKAEDFIAAGVACYAFSLIDELGLLDQLLSGQNLPYNIFLSYPNPLVVKTALQALECSNIIFFDEHVFQLTSFGKSLARHRGSIGLIYNGYRETISNQLRIAQDQPSQNWDLIDSEAITKAASQMGDEFFNTTLLSILRKHSIKGTICDLGCGNASTLMYLCRKEKLPGLGFDFFSSSIDVAKGSLNQNDKITLLTKDITKIDEVYPEVEVLLQSFVMHDFSDAVCRKTIQSLLTSFPKARLFLYLDAVSPVNENPLQLPGFDYIHSLLGIKPRTLKETSNLLADSGLHIMNLDPIQGLTNCYIWTLCPLKQEKNEY